MQPAGSFVAFLERRLAENPPLQKGQRTRERLRIATARVLAEKGYHGLRAIDVTEAAGFAEGSFYIYFRDKADASLDVLTSLLNDFVGPRLESPTRYPTPFSAIRAANRAWFELCRDNPGLFRCVLQLGDEIPEFSALIHSSNHDWYGRIAAGVVRRHPKGAVDLLSAHLAAYMLGAMMDEMTRKALVYPNTPLNGLLAELGEDVCGLADAASVLWMRFLYPDVRIEEPLTGAARKLAQWPGAAGVGD